MCACQEEGNQDCGGVFMNVSPHWRPFVSNTRLSFYFVLVYDFIVFKLKTAK